MPIVLGIAATMFAAGTLVIVLSTMGVNDAVTAYPRQQGYHHYGGMALKPGHYAAGTIASLQNDENGNPTWIVSGHWKASLTNVTKVGPYGGGGNQTANQTSTSAAAANNTAAEDNRQPTATFKGMFDMVMTNGSAMHKHQIYNFTLSNMSMPDNTTMVYNGTATITMKDGPVPNVPISGTVMEGNVHIIRIDPSKVNNHFGDTPIYGTVVKAFEVKK
jgi:hypothetical protein